jgi:hypothetical protein
VKPVFELDAHHDIMVLCESECQKENRRRKLAPDERLPSSGGSFSVLLNRLVILQDSLVFHQAKLENYNFHW